MCRCGDVGKVCERLSRSAEVREGVCMGVNVSDDMRRRAGCAGCARVSEGVCQGLCRSA